MNSLFTEDAWQDYLYWQEHEKKILKKVNDLIKEITREPFSGTGKPEALRFALKGYWSRRITQEKQAYLDWVDDAEAEFGCEASVVPIEIIRQGQEAADAYYEKILEKRAKENAEIRSII